MLNSLRWFLILFMLIGSVLSASVAFAQLGVLTTYESEGKAEVKGSNFVKARKSAVWRAMRGAVDQALDDLLGKESSSMQGAVKQIRSSPKRFVKSYRFLESTDDEAGQTSLVRLEVVVFTDALNKELNSAGLVSSAVNPKAVVVLVMERSFTARPMGGFWDYVPMSEVTLAKNLVGAGVHVIRRDRVAGVVGEDRVSYAARGDVTAAVDIGLKAGAGIVIVGNAASSRLSGSDKGPVTVQANLSVKVVSVIKSRVIAAKSDFATARALDPVEGELQAFEIVGKKMAVFLSNTIKRYWKPEAVATQPIPGQTKSATKTPPPVSSKPGLMEDL